MKYEHKHLINRTLTQIQEVLGSDDCMVTDYEATMYNVLLNAESCIETLKQDAKMAYKIILGQARLIRDNDDQTAKLLSEIETLKQQISSLCM